jgi:hypothetical protein
VASGPDRLLVRTGVSWPPSLPAQRPATRTIAARLTCSLRGRCRTTSREVPVRPRRSRVTVGESPEQHDVLCSGGAGDGEMTFETGLGVPPAKKPLKGANARLPSATL